MNPEYQRLHEEAKQLFFHLNDVCDDKSAAGALLSNAKNVMEEFEMNKNPHTIEDVVKGLIMNFQQLQRSGAPIMQIEHFNDFISGYENLRQQIRELSNY